MSMPPEPTGSSSNARPDDSSAGMKPNLQEEDEDRQAAAKEVEAAEKEAEAADS